MKVYILDNGYLECDSNWMVAMSSIGTVDNPNAPAKWIQIPVYCVLIDHPQGWVLYDTGCHPDAMKGYWPKGLCTVFPYYYSEDQLLVNQLAKVGVKPEDIKTVVISHLHLDHAGNLHLFPHADVYVDKLDFQNALLMTHANPDPATHGPYIKEDVVKNPISFKIITEDMELVPGIRLIQLPGHVPGQLGMVIKLDKEGTLIFPMDALYQATNYGPPVVLSGIIADSVSFVNSIEKVRKIAKQENAKVMFSHDMEFYKTMKLAPAFYE